MGAAACPSDQAAPLTITIKHLGSIGEQQHLCWTGLVLLGIPAASVHDTTAFPQGLESCCWSLPTVSAALGSSSSCLLACAATCQVMQDVLPGSCSHGPGQRWGAAAGGLGLLCCDVVWATSPREFAACHS